MLVVVKGEDKVIQVSLERKSQTTCEVSPQDLTGMTISVKFKNSAGLQTVSGTIVNGPLGKLTFPIDKAVSELLKVGLLDFDVHVVDSSAELEIWKFEQKIMVKDRIR